MGLKSGKKMKGSTDKIWNEDNSLVYGGFGTSITSIEGGISFIIGREWGRNERSMMG